MLIVYDGASERSQNTGLTRSLARGYEALWIPPERTNRLGLFYFRVKTGDGRLVCTEPFSLDLNQRPYAQPSAGKCPSP